MNLVYGFISDKIIKFLIWVNFLLHCFYRLDAVMMQEKATCTIKDASLLKGSNFRPFLFY